MIECVPNFSEGRDEATINAIVEAMGSVSGTYILGVDRGIGANRTVVTMAGSSDSILKAVFQGIQKASERIDMRSHVGVHPRLGATDVCPFIPLEDTDMKECVELANELGQKVGEELGIPVYLYGEAAREQSRRNLAEIRQGQYESLKTRVDKPDYGPVQFNERSGATVIGARQILVAYNISLDTTDLGKAREIARNIRESGFFKRTRTGIKRRVPGKLKSVRALGWLIEEYGCCQVSTNILDYHTTPLRTVFDAVKEEASNLGIRIRGSEVVGLLPEEALVPPGSRNSLEKEIELLGLSAHYQFDPNLKVIEYRLENLMRDREK